eukprot:351395-Chlamydomonas_euryale.AAC.11
MPPSWRALERCWQGRAVGSAAAALGHGVTRILPTRRRRAPGTRPASWRGLRQTQYAAHWERGYEYAAAA